MNAYEAVMKAADQIERHPEVFRFSASMVPHSCDSPGCALGWIGFYAGVGRSFLKAAYLTLGLPNHTEFYLRLTELTRPDGYGPCPEDFKDIEWAWGSLWTRDSALCAKGLRLYADKYLKPETPDWNAMAQADNAYRPVREEA